VPDNEWDKAQRLTFEKEMLGLYVSDHPLLGAQAALRRHTNATIAELRDAGEAPGAAETGGSGGSGAPGGREFGELRTVGGVVTNLVRKYTKRGDLMAVFALEDLDASIEVMVFPKTMLEYGHVLAPDTLVTVRGRLDDRDDVPKLVAMEIRRPDISLDGGGPPVRVQLPETVRERVVQDLKRLLTSHPGDSDVFVHFGRKVLRLPPEYRVDGSTRLISELRVLLGPSALVA
jgi:DNA polymerase-3 subunit alpha